MTHAKNITLIALVSALVTLSGCLESGRNESAQLRWQRTMNQARLQAAQNSLQQGQLELAERLMEEHQATGPKAAVNEQARQVEAEIQHERKQFAKAGIEVKSIEEMVY